MGGEYKRHQMMQFFGDQFEDEEELESEHKSNLQLNYDEVEEGVRQENEERERETKGKEDVDVESESEDVCDGEMEVDIGDHRGDDSQVRDIDRDVKDDYSQRVVTNKYKDGVESGSEENHDEEVDASKTLSGSLKDDKDQNCDMDSVQKIRDVFGDFDDEEDMTYVVQQEIQKDSTRYPAKNEGGYRKSLRLKNILTDEDHQYKLEDETIEMKTKDMSLGPPLELEVPLHPPPALPDKMNIIKVSNIMGVDPKPFDRNTYEEEDNFVTDEYGKKKCIRLAKNIVRWRKVTNPDGTTSVESNARFVRWSDGSLQLLIGNEALNISEQDAQHDQSHLFLKHEKGILQSQGRLLRKMRFIPSSLSSNSTGESRQKKVYKVKNYDTDMNTDREKEEKEKEKAQNQTIVASKLCNRKREKENHKYTPTERRRELSVGLLKGALNEEPKDIHHKSPFPPATSSLHPMDDLDDEGEDTKDDEEEEKSIFRKKNENFVEEYDNEEEDYKKMALANNALAEEEEEGKEPKKKNRNLRGIHRRMIVMSDSDDE